jgi:colicin import membrane protein
MKTDRLSSYLPFSVGLHSLLVIAAIIYILYAGTHYKVTTFEVSLVDSSSGRTSSAPARVKEESQPAPEVKKNVRIPEKNEKITKKEINDVDERIAAIEAKKKIETMARLRKSISVSKTSSGTKEASATSSKPGPSGGGTYDDLIQSRIHRFWNNADFLNQDLLAIVAIRIQRNGDITILGFERKSGNPLFDREALKALNDASPLPPPPREMERNFRFTP